MTQPPDPAEPPPSEPTATPSTPPTDDQPTVAWTPSDASGRPSEPAASPPVAVPTVDAASPIISAAPLAGAAGASGTPFATAEPAVPGAPPAADAPLVGWTPPGPAAPVATSDGFVLAGVGARLVAYLLDWVIVAIIPGVLSLLVSDFSAIGDAIKAGRSAGSPVLTPVTTQTVLIELIGLGINFLYFVGLWTSGWRATLGQRLLSIQVADAATGHGLSLLAASKRWLLFGAPLGLLAFLPGVAGYSGLASTALLLLLLITTVMDARKQGLQDKVASSLVIRRATSGSGAILAGCLLLILIVGLIAIIFSAVAAAAMAPQLRDLLDEIGNSI